ncbi:hypothetical protein TWF102_009362 [Orbilia oligospora]|uniref:Uncharacterized protein n=1 Tax=Orbilia oligospora TaxID=2813651 RepID=A0A7C8NLS1_ORBOL|nr:hypothetical protein TWF102_009362 [Orbilia oligospora]KAF3103858.1 hypothetical protein TWF103_007016 [Orbilia oligospora]
MIIWDLRGQGHITMKRPQPSTREHQISYLHSWSSVSPLIHSFPIQTCHRHVHTLSIGPPPLSCYNTTTRLSLLGYRSLRRSSHAAALPHRKDKAWGERRENFDFGM